MTYKFIQTFGRLSGLATVTIKPKERITCKSLVNSRIASLARFRTFNM